MNNLYEIKNGAVTLYVNHYKHKEFMFHGFTIGGDTENYYVEYCGNEPCPNGRKAIKLNDYLLQMYKSEADTQLQKYIEDHINDYNFYSKCDEDGFMFWNKVINSAGIEPKYRYHYELRLDEAVDGIISIIINRVACRYSFVEGKTIGFMPNGYSNLNTNISAMDIFYKSYLEELLALEQYKREISVPAYDELARLRTFLAEKKSVRIVMRSGAVYELKPTYGIRAGDILKQYEDNGRLCFRINNSYCLKPNLRNVMTLNELDCLMYGRQKHYINAVNLSNYQRKGV